MVKSQSRERRLARTAFGAGKGVPGVIVSSGEPVLVHLHPDFQQPLEDLLETWNATQHSWNFVGLRPRREAERTLLTPGSISDDEASLLASEMRASTGHSPQSGIVVFTEKRLFDEEYYQLFVGGRAADDDPPGIAI